MRTTVTIDEELYRTVKERAARAGRSIGETIEDALRRAFSDEGGAEKADLVPLPTDGGTGVLPGIDLSSNVAVREAMDGGTAVDALR